MAKNVKLHQGPGRLRGQDLVNSKISDATLKAIADQKEDYKPSKKDAAVAQNISKKLAGCIG